ncbi:hypothetical protein GCM10008983_25140 [Lentibacillus halophilus]|uniref:Aspartyl-phosphate phosphatase Spo0E family protein n=1 Tax=Lentibacillus halophilus TaxID=295065 RepID=A0ABN0ZFU8_9BACI
MNADELLNHIERLRRHMTVVALEKGFTSHESIKLSQELDRLMNHYDSMKHTGNTC